MTFIFTLTNAMKETLANENDRKTASPTESAVRGSWRREHSGADGLNQCLTHDTILGSYVSAR